MMDGCSSPVCEQSQRSIRSHLLTTNIEDKHECDDRGSCVKFLSVNVTEVPARPRKSGGRICSVNSHSDADQDAFGEFWATG